MSADLQLAAKAAGIELVYVDGIGWGYWTARDFITWHPVEDDGDSQRLATKLRRCVCHHHSNDNPAVTAMAGVEWHGKFMEADALHGNDVEAATRRAIFRVAVEIGRAMP